MKERREELRGCIQKPGGIKGSSHDWRATKNSGSHHDIDGLLDSSNMLRR